MRKNIKRIIGVFLLIFVLAAPIITTTGDEDPKPQVNNCTVIYNA